MYLGRALLHFNVTYVILYVLIVTLKGDRNMKFSKQIIVNAPAEKVWGVLGRDFANVGKWATLVAHSEVNTEAPVVNNSPVGGRLCNTSIGKISEEFTAYDDSKKTLSFKGVFDSKLFDSVVNSSEISSIDENTALVKITPEIKLSFLGSLMTPIIKIQLGKAIDKILDDLKYYAENGKPSPAKIASQEK